jgi:hypothetical protein
VRETEARLHHQATALPGELRLVLVAAQVTSHKEQHKHSLPGCIFVRSPPPPPAEGVGLAVRKFPFEEKKKREAKNVNVRNRKIKGRLREN